MEPTQPTALRPYSYHGPKRTSQCAESGCLGGGVAMRIWLFFVIALFVGSASAADRSFGPVANDGQVIEYEDGESFLVERTGRAVVMVSFVPRDKKSAWVKVGVKNLSDATFNIADTSVSVASGGTALEVMTYADRMKEQKRQQMWAGVAAGLAAGANNIAASNAGYQHNYGTYSGTTNAYARGPAGSAYGTATTNGSYFGSSYNASAAFQAQQTANAQNQAIFDRQQANPVFAQRDLQDRALKANTLSPGEFVLGDVRFSLPRRNKEEPSELVITIDIAGEPATFRFIEH
jgi:hypothetical protein